MSSSRAAPDSILSWLRSLGYRATFRRDGWIECLLSFKEERWLGRGVDRGEALDDALAQMLPSQAARTLLVAHFSAQSPRRKLVEAIEAASFQDVEPPAQTGDGALSDTHVVAEPPGAVDRVPAAGVDDRPGAASRRAEEPTAAAEHVPADADAPPEPSQEGEPATREPVPEEAETSGASETAETMAAAVGSSDGSEPGEADAPAEQSRTILAAPAPEPLDPDEALGDIAILAELIESEQVELALMTPERQRLAILSWICHARAIEAASDGHQRVVSRVTAIARKLTHLSKLWWPGSVLALQIDATPYDVGRELDLPARSRPRSWSEAAEAAEQRLVAVEERDEKSDCDEYGWADGPFLNPAPMDPPSAMIELQRLVEQVGGSLQQVPPKRPSPEVRRPPGDLAEQRYQWACRVRWLRGFTTDFEAWGALMGRLRWMAAQSDRRDEQLEAALAPGFKPQRGWASLLGQDPEAKRKRRLRKAVIRARPGSNGEPDMAVLVAWLTDAFQVLEASRIANLLAPYRSAVLTLGADDIPDANRYTRRRLRAVQKHLESLAGAGACPPPEDLDTGDDELPDDENEGLLGVESTDVAKVLLTKVRPRTAGLKALFVTNRADPALEAVLRDTFGFEDLHWCEGSPRRVQTVAERILAGTYDLVLGATGFQSHSVDTHLLRACRRASVRYVRVHRGRQLACLLALARELGVDATEKPGIAGAADDAVGP